jgi:multidrug efflux pump subunit AcrA (membrane-fusion protein)
VRLRGRKGVKIDMQVVAKRRKWPIVVIVIAAVCVAAYFLLPRLITSQGGTGSSQAASAGIVSAEAALGDVVTSVNATGSITDSAVDVNMPYGVEVSEILVGSGEEVRKGDPVAKVDSSALSQAITDAKSDLSDVNDELEAIADKDNSDFYVNSKLQGTVEEVFAKEGDSAAKVISEHGALMTIKLSDGGTFKVRNDKGTVSTVYKEEGDTVYSGTSLFKLSVPDAVTGKKSLTEKRDKLLDLIEKLTALQTTKCIYATANGKIGNINVTAGAVFENMGEVSSGGESAGAETSGSALAGTSGSALTGTSGTAIYDNEGAAFSVIIPGKADMTVGVDELDIAAVKEGQEASVAFDALEGQTFSGIVTDVSDTADTSSGVASFSATITLDTAEGMLGGMSATATIVKEKKVGVVTIPLEAVQQYGEDLFVYTQLADDGSLSGEVKIETGLSDGAVTEVTSGLEEGATVYYTPSDDGSNGMFSQGGNAMFGGPGVRTFRAGPGPESGGSSAPSGNGGGGGE